MLEYRSDDVDILKDLVIYYYNKFNQLQINCNQFDQL